MEKPIYILGGVGLDGEFTFTGSFYGGRMIYHDIKDAEEALKNATTKSNGWVRQYHIYQIKPENLIRIETNSGLADYKLLYDIVKIDTMFWLSPDMEKEVDIFANWGYHRSKNLITISFDYTFGYRFFSDKTKEYEQKMMDRFYFDLENQVKFILIPRIKKALERTKSGIKVEFKNKCTGTKIIKGFITKE